MWWTLIVLTFIFWLIALSQHVAGIGTGMLLATWIVLAVARLIDMRRSKTPRIHS
ncbi:MAG: hypothetical protein IT176_15410 [Acidobacteria bacterium]|nr:hypothetical protein [Acidobacteriota bacterium]